MIKKRKLCKRVGLLASALMISVFISACSSGKNVDEDEAESSAGQESALEENVDGESSEDEQIRGYTYCWDYTDEYAWVCYIGDDVRYLAVIDKDGEMLYKYDTGFLTFTADEAKSSVICQDGYAYLKPDSGDGQLVVLSPTGTAVKYEFDEFESESGILAYGNGSVITWNSYSDFDSEGYVYTLYNSAGEIVKQVKSSENTDEGLSYWATYCGNDIFCVDIPAYLDSSGSGQNCYSFYNAEGDELASIEYTSDEDKIEPGTFIDGETFMYLGMDATVSEDYWGEETSTYELIFMDVEGNITRVSSDYRVVSEDFTPVVSDGKCLFIGADSDGSHYMIYDLEKGSFSELVPENEDKISLYSLQSALMFKSGNLVIPLKGQDGNSYIEVLDEEGNLLLEPTLADEYYGFTDGMLIVKADGEYDIYDTELNLVYSLSGTEYDFIREYSNNVAYVSGEDFMATYLDKEGNLIFDEVVAVNVEEIYATTISLSEVNADDAEEYIDAEDETGNGEDAEQTEIDEESSGESAASASFDEDWYKNNTYTDEDGNVMSFGWLDDGWFEIEFEWGVYSAYDLDSIGYTITDEGYYRYDGDGYCIEYDAENNAVLFVPGAGGSVWYYAD